MESELVVFGSMTHPGAGEERAGSMQQHDIRNILPIGRITGSDHLTGLLCSAVRKQGKPVRIMTVAVTTIRRNRGIIGEETSFRGITGSIPGRPTRDGRKNKRADIVGPHITTVPALFVARSSRDIERGAQDGARGRGLGLSRGSEHRVNGEGDEGTAREAKAPFSTAVGVSKGIAG